MNPEILEAATRRWVESAAMGIRAMRQMGGVGLKEALVLVEERVQELDHLDERTRRTHEAVMKQVAQAARAVDSLDKSE